jgi:hypothetical protein
MQGEEEQVEKEETTAEVNGILCIFGFLVSVDNPPDVTPARLEGSTSMGWDFSFVPFEICECCWLCVSLDELDEEFFDEFMLNIDSGAHW